MTIEVSKIAVDRFVRTISVNVVLMAINDRNLLDNLFSIALSDQREFMPSAFQWAKQAKHQTI